MCKSKWKIDLLLDIYSAKINRKRLKAIKFNTSGTIIWAVSEGIWYIHPAKPGEPGGILNILVTGSGNHGVKVVLLTYHFLRQRYAAAPDEKLWLYLCCLMSVFLIWKIKHVNIFGNLLIAQFAIAEIPINGLWLYVFCLQLIYEYFTRIYLCSI